MPIPVTHRAPAVPKRVVLFGFLLGVSLAILGLLGSYLVTRLNADYNEIVTTRLPSLSLIREINKNQSIARQAVESLMAVPAPVDIDAVWAKVVRLRQENSERIDKLDELINVDEGEHLIVNLREVRKLFHTETEAFFQVVAEGADVNQLVRQRARMTDMDIKYMDAQNRVAEYCEQSAAERSDDLTRRTNGVSRFFFVVAAWPLILAVGFFVYGLISTLSLFYRSRENY